MSTTVEIEADYGLDIIFDVGGGSHVKFAGGTDNAGVVDGPVRIRAAERFDVSEGSSGIPVDAVIEEILFTYTVQNVDGASAESWTIGPYNGNGQGDPETDNDATAYNRCDTSTDNYLTTTNLRTTGTKTVDLTTAQSIEDLSDALGGGTFCIALKMVDETTAPVRNSRIWSYDREEASEKPILTVTYSEAPVASSSFAFWRWR